MFSIARILGQDGSFNDDLSDMPVLERADIVERSPTVPRIFTHLRETQPKDKIPEIITLSDSPVKVNQVGGGESLRPPTPQMPGSSRPDTSVPQKTRTIFARAREMGVSSVELAPFLSEHKGVKRVIAITGEGSSKRKRFNTFEATSLEEEPSALSKKFYRIIREAVGKSSKFLGGKYTGTFCLMDFQHCLDPEEVLREIFNYAIDQAVKQCDELGVTADRLIVNISSTAIQYDIPIAFHEINQDSAETILHRFQIVENSNKGAEGASLHNMPFTVDATVFSLKGLQKKISSTPPSVTTGSRKRGLFFHLNINRGALYVIDNSDNLCLFRSINFLRARTIMPSDHFKNYKINDHRQLADIKEMMQVLHIPQNLPAYAAEEVVPKIQQYYNQKYPEEKFKIFVFNDINGYTPVFASDVQFFKNHLAIYHHNNHFDPIVAITSFFNCDGFCLFCYLPYKTQFEHRVKCMARCLNCCKINYEHGRCPFQYGYEIECRDCRKIFNNHDCYLRHMERKLCDRSKRCPDCGVIYNVKVNTRNGRKGHECIEKHCNTCYGFHDPSRACNMQPLKTKPEEHYRIICFDYESTQEYEVEPNTMKFDHRVNFISATVICTICISKGSWKEPLVEECDICGKDRTFAWTHVRFDETEVDCQYVTQNPLRDFTRWVLYYFNEGKQKPFYTVALSHFGGRYDMVLLFGEIFRLGGLAPSLIKQGNKLFEMVIKKKGLVTKTFFRDTFNLMPVALEKLPKTFELKDVQNKLFFPHLANKFENLRKVLPNLPPPEDYLYGGMKADKRAKFDQWYSANKNTPFNLREKLAEYCCADVHILVNAVVEMRNLFQGITGLDILQKVTIASACMDHFLTNHLAAEHLPIIPEHGYLKKFNQSALARKFLKWYAYYEKQDIQDNESPLGEKQYRQYHLDGFVKRPGQKDLALEVYGCYWHGCPNCYPNPQTIVSGGQTAEFVRERTENRANGIRETMELREFWECKIKETLAMFRPMKEFFDKAFDSGAISLRDGFFGGRTGPEKMYAEATNGRSIAYMDIMSLYPSINFNGSYPVKHPKPLVHNTDENWTCSADNLHKGIIKCLVVPPRYNPDRPIIPILPVRLERDSRLLFPLCRTCSIENKTGSKDVNYSCPHDNEMDRAFTVTATHPELNKALDSGYVVKRLYRTYEFEEFDDNLFKDYVREMLAVKIQASGWPANCVSDSFKGDLPDLKDPSLDDETKDIILYLNIKRTKFIDETKERYEIDLQPEKIKRNEGLRYIAKLCLNSLWGRFSLRNNLSKSIIVDRPEKLVELFTDASIEILAGHQLNEDAMMLTTKTIEEFVVEHKTSNVVVSLWTTSLARLHLLKYLEQLNDRSDVEILYMDTDSVIYSYETSAGNPIVAGEFLGDMTDEYSGHDILEFISGGCKQYGLKLRKKGEPEAEIEYVRKCRGITLDHDADLRLSYEEFKRRVLSYGDPELPLMLNYNMLRPNVAQGSVRTVKTSKKYEPVISKGIVVENYRVVPFGFVKK